MTLVTRKSLFTVALLILLGASIQPAGASVNKSIRIAAGETADGASSVNGSITIGEGAIVTGDVSTVNGSVRVGDNAELRDASTVNGTIRIGPGVRAGDLETVNGAVRIDENVAIDGHVEAVNGAIQLGRGTTVTGHVENVNGNIELVAATVGDDVTTVSGDVELRDAATVRGDLVVEKPSRWSWGRDRRKPEIVIGPGSRVLGTVRLEHEVELYISETAEVGGVSGVMTLEDAVRFGGERP
ncbi:MAG: hypothetical protein R3176_03405 [Woeseiaceae bacterium]|nr:hypothetical protein [Woeseiaceae bacterium]